MELLDICFKNIRSIVFIILLYTVALIFGCIFFQGVKHMFKVLTEEPGRCQITLLDVDWPRFLKSNEGLRKTPRLSIIRSSVNVSSIRGHVGGQKVGDIGDIGDTGKPSITSKSVMSIWFLFCNQFCIVEG